MRNGIAVSLCIVFIALVSASSEVFAANKERGSRADRDHQRFNRLTPLRRGLRSESKILCRVVPVRCGTDTKFIERVTTRGIGSTNFVLQAASGSSPASHVGGFAGYVASAKNPLPPSLFSGFRSIRIFVKATDDAIRYGRVKFRFETPDGGSKIIEKRWTEMHPSQPATDGWRTLSLSIDADFPTANVDRLYESFLLKFSPYLFIEPNTSPSPKVTALIGDFSATCATRESIFGGGTYQAVEFTFFPSTCGEFPVR